jgi:hypothetical protein
MADVNFDQEITKQTQGEQCPLLAFMESKSFFSFCSVVEVKGSHAIYVSQPEALAALIKQAAEV